MPSKVIVFKSPKSTVLSLSRRLLKLINAVVAFLYYRTLQKKKRPLTKQIKLPTVEKYVIFHIGFRELETDVK